MGLTFTGNTSSSVTSDAVNGLPMLLESFSVVNKTAGTIAINVYKMTAGGNICIAPLNQSLATGQMYEGERDIVVLATQRIKLQVSGEVDYDFTINNLPPP